MSKAPHIALLGCGYWGKNLARNLHELGALRLVCDPAESGRLTVAEIAPGVETSSEFNDALRSGDIEAVVIATPAETHFELAAAALNAGKDVLFEKHGKPIEATVSRSLRPLLLRAFREREDCQRLQNGAVQILP